MTNNHRRGEGIKVEIGSGGGEFSCLSTSSATSTTATSVSVLNSHVNQVFDLLRATRSRLENGKQLRRLMEQLKVLMAPDDPGCQVCNITSKRIKTRVQGGARASCACGVIFEVNPYLVVGTSAIRIHEAFVITQDCEVAFYGPHTLLPGIILHQRCVIIIARSQIDCDISRYLVCEWISSICGIFGTSTLDIDDCCCHLALTPQGGASPPNSRWHHVGACGS